jgi:hypothetical protein
MALQTSIFPQNLDSHPTPQVFARHETFHPRFGWLKKGFDRASQDSSIFLREDAPVLLGVGKNMVRSIRYWCGAFKLLENDAPTEFGRKLLASGGWDEYLEDPASLWLLHWQLLQPPTLATTWDFTFNQFRPIEFTQDTLFSELRGYCDGLSKNIVDGSLKKDITCLLRMYVRAGSKSVANEDMLDCPFADLGAITTSGDSRHYTFRVGYKPTLPSAAIGYACLSYAGRVNPTARTIPISNLLYYYSSPGLVFRLTERSMCEAIEKVARQFPEITISDAAGKLQLSFDSEPQQLADNILEHYYQIL